MSGGTRTPTRVSRHRPAPRRRFGGARPWLPWALAGLLAVACAALVAALVLDDGESSKDLAAEAGASALEPRARIVGFPVDVDDAPSAVAVGPRTVWVVHEGSGTLATVDPRRNEMVGTLTSVGGRPRYVAIAGTAVWVSTSTRAPSPG